MWRDKADYNKGQQGTTDNLAVTNPATVQFICSSFLTFVVNDFEGAIRIKFRPFWGWSVSQVFCSLGSFHDWLTATVIYAWWGWSNWGPVACVSPVLEWEAQTGMWQSLTSTSKDSHGCTALDMPVKGNDWADELVRWSSHHMWFESRKIWNVWEFFC